MTRRGLLSGAAKLLAGLAVGAGGLVAARTATARNRYYAGPVSDHFDGTEFFNPGGVPPRGFGDLLRWQFDGQRAAWPEQWPSPHAPARPAARVDGSALVVTHLGHASFLYQTSGLNILVDPVLSDRMSPVSFAGPKRVNPPGIAFGDLPPIDLVLITHNHYDHLDLASLGRIVGQHDPLIVTPHGNDAIIRKDIAQARLAALDWGDHHVAGDLTIHAVPCHHWSARGMGDRRHALWAAFVLEGPAGLIHHVGDTGFDGGKPFTHVRERFGRPRLAVLPIGAYEPRWFMAGQHQNPEEAVQAFRILEADHGIGHHWGTVQLTNEAIDAPRVALTEALAKAGLAEDRFAAALPGMTFTFAPR